MNKTECKMLHDLKRFITLESEALVTEVGESADIETFSQKIIGKIDEIIYLYDKENSSANNTIYQDFYIKELHTRLETGGIGLVPFAKSISISFTVIGKDLIVHAINTDKGNIIYDKRFVYIYPLDEFKSLYLEILNNIKRSVNL